MIATVHPGKINGGLTANASKSAMQRACAAALLKQGATTIVNPGNSNDDKAALSIIAAMGAGIQALPDGSLRITGVQRPFAHAMQGGAIHCGESGLSIRMFTPLAVHSAGFLGTSAGAYQWRRQLAGAAHAFF